MSNNVYNRFFDKKKWEEVNKYNKDLMEDYLTEMKANKKKQGTIDQYRNDLRIILLYIYDELDNKSMDKLKKKNFRNLMLHFQSKEMSNARINRLMSALRSMLEFASNEEDYEDDIEINYAAKVKGLSKEKTREIHFLTDAEIQIIYNHLIGKGKYQQALLCAFMYESCSRRNEVYQVKRSDISLDSNICKTTVKGKRGKVYRPLYNDMTKEAFKMLEESRKDNNDYLWTVSNGSPASYETLYNWVISWRKILQDETGIYKEFNPHSFRHSGANNLENGTHYLCRKLGKKFDLIQIQKLMNHSDISTTQSYLEDKSEAELLEAFGI